MGIKYIVCRLNVYWLHAFLFIRNRVLPPLKLQKLLELQKHLPFEIRNFLYKKPRNFTLIFVMLVLISFKSR